MPVSILNGLVVLIVGPFFTQTFHKIKVSIFCLFFKMMDLWDNTIGCSENDVIFLLFVLFIYLFIYMFLKIGKQFFGWHLFNMFQFFLLIVVVLMLQSLLLFLEHVVAFDLHCPFCLLLAFASNHSYKYNWLLEYLIIILSELYRFKL